MTEKNIMVQLDKPERKYVKVYHDFLDNSLLTTAEQMIFIVLKSHIDFSSDNGQVFPSIKTICRRSKLSESSTRRTINSLIKKGIVKKLQRGLTKTNLYILSDRPAMWNSDNIDDMKEAENDADTKHLTLEQHIAELEKMGYEVEIKEKKLVCSPSKAHTSPSDQ